MRKYSTQLMLAATLAMAGAHVMTADAATTRSSLPVEGRMAGFNGATTWRQLCAADAGPTARQGGAGDKHCASAKPPVDSRYRRVLWIALFINAAMFGVELLGGLRADGTVLVLLYAFRDGDANMRSAWLCSRNDAIAYVAVIAAALGVFGTGANWPDLAMAAVMAVLGLSAARIVIAQSRGELARAANQRVAQQGR